MSEKIEGIEAVRAIVWDFDGVLNRAGQREGDGMFPWQRKVGEELGIDARSMGQAVFGRDKAALFEGREDVLDRLAEWGAETGAEFDPEDVLEIWFETDHDPDPELERLLPLLTQAGIAQVILTNNEARRTRWIMHEAGWAGQVDAVFASGEIGAMKPSVAAFAHVEQALDMPAHEILLIDDTPANVAAAEKRGWLGWDYEPDGAMALVQALMPLLVRSQD
ncbi:HAD-IA family hydrolase [Rhodobacter sp. NTK016B]|uniref:HAD-IA family hydrolase n=1 Tax=Rhodobacter sp. NTK016B TaxID=2759676 RepID=UPI001A90A107|nr:HAD-IA family hydrolase [Rhodobacter sp. NTK016B]MBN8291705.1 HAD-IA family hydrolase [Rhodobacter sp. NTK016B]